jgi:hypothetical protein
MRKVGRRWVKAAQANALTLSGSVEAGVPQIKMTRWRSRWGARRVPRLAESEKVRQWRVDKPKVMIMTGQTAVARAPMIVPSF